MVVKAPQLVDLGMGYLIGTGPVLDICNALYGALGKCTSIRSLSLGIIDLGNRLLPAVYPICHNLTSLKLSPCLISADFNRLIRRCIKLECLWFQGTFITDEELCVLASTCKELQELRIIDSPVRRNLHITEQGLVALSAGCPKLKKLNYICNEISNEALITVAENCPNLVSFTLHNSWECIGKRVEDVMAMQPLDEGFGAIVRLCKGLKRLRLCGRLTDQVFLYIGKYAKHLEVLTVNLIKVTTLGPRNRTLLDFQVPHFAGDSEKGILYVLNGCKKLKELDIRNSSFGNATLLEDVRKYERMQCLYIENCQMNFGACKQLAHEMPSLKVEIIRKKTMRPPGNNTVIINPGDNDKINKMYLYRTLVGPRKDATDYVLTL
ncbi:hypothetical protein CQW23_03829 [Capsicum baccatum]|uniref:Uncharacterized protein n=1 Tax=Capsicum baccatum TaxID=33114 RepID=A0A2G2XCX3_CAPBA|nr:hypothetical protein CQW23_03829 [Capsicum baccatum]